MKRGVITTMGKQQNDKDYLNSLNDDEKLKLFYKYFMEFRMNSELIPPYRICLTKEYPNDFQLINDFQWMYMVHNFLDPWYKIYKILFVGIKGYRIDQHPNKFWEQMNLYYESIRHPRVGIYEWDSKFDIRDFFFVMEQWGLDFYRSMKENKPFSRDLNLDPKLEIKKNYEWNDSNKIRMLKYWFLVYKKCYTIFCKLTNVLSKTKWFVEDKRNLSVFWLLTSNTPLFTSWYSINEILKSGIKSFKLINEPEIPLYKEIMRSFGAERRFTEEYHTQGEIPFWDNLEKMERWFLDIVDKNFKKEWDEQD